MRAVDESEAFIVTRNGVPVGEFTPLRRHGFTAAEAAVTMFRAAPSSDDTRTSRPDRTLPATPTSVAGDTTGGSGPRPPSTRSLSMATQRAPTAGSSPQSSRQAGKHAAPALSTYSSWGRPSPRNCRSNTRNADDLRALDDLVEVVIV